MSKMYLDKLIGNHLTIYHHDFRLSGTLRKADKWWYELFIGKWVSIRFMASAVREFNCYEIYLED